MLSRLRTKGSIARALGGAVFAGGALQGALLASGILAARLLGPDDRGHLAVLVLIPSLIAQLGGLGLPLAVTHFVARDDRTSRQVAAALWRPALIQTLVLTAIHAAVLVVVVHFEPGLPVAA